MPSTSHRIATIAITPIKIFSGGEFRGGQVIKNTLAILLSFVMFPTLPVSAQGSRAGVTGQVEMPAHESKMSLRLGPGDLIHVTVYEMPELDQHIRVSDQGTATFS